MPDEKANISSVKYICCSLSAFLNYMDQFIVSARKYRPQTFDEVVGQSTIAETLKNAIRNSHLAQAFLFCGPRGVGKTTCARILARTINCMNRGENMEACGQCDSCVAFSEGHSLNIYELDAASNNSVDDIRNLIEQVRFAPQMGNKKVYIIDEVHMLSTQAFNAFLKTLEEPPEHAIFILATTEKHKIIPTILSRCQIFDFHRIQIEDMITHLEKIAQKENITTDHDGLHLIAQKADGALRDALTLFDQLVTFSGNSLSYQEVIKHLNILDYDYYFKVTDSVIQGDTQSCLLLFNEILDRGFEGHHFIVGLAEHFRNLLVSLDEKTITLLEVGKNVKERYFEQSKKCKANYLIDALGICNQCDVDYKTSSNQRLLVEFTLLRLAALSGVRPSEGNIEKKNNEVSTVAPEATQNESSPMEEQASETTEIADTKNAVEDVKPVDESHEENHILEDVPTETAEIKETATEPEIVEHEVHTVTDKEEQPVAENITAEEEPVAEKLPNEEQPIVEEQPMDNLPVEEISDTGETLETTSVTSTGQIPTEPVQPQENKTNLFKKPASSGGVLGTTVDDLPSIKVASESASQTNADVEVLTSADVEEESEANVDETSMLHAWKEMAEHFNRKGRISLFASLTKNQPTIDENGEITLLLDNLSQEETITGYKTEMLSMLRNNLEAPHLTLKTVVDKKNISKKAYTTKEKFDELAKKNPSIQKLKDDLNLELL